MRQRTTTKFGSTLVTATRSPFEQLLNGLPILKGAPGVTPFNPSRLLAWLCNTAGLSELEQFGARFALQLWSPKANWVDEALKLGLRHPHRARTVELMEAAILDPAHRAVLATWLQDPVFGNRSL